jgi:preprotein translocase subunit SecF
LVVGTLFFFGGEVLRTFALALILGVIIGTYSSVFVASPIVVEWESRSPRRFKN